MMLHWAVLCWQVFKVFASSVILPPADIKIIILYKQSLYIVNDQQTYSSEGKTILNSKTVICSGVHSTSIEFIFCFSFTVTLSTTGPSVCCSVWDKAYVLS